MLACTCSSSSAASACPTTLHVWNRNFTRLDANRNTTKGSQRHPSKQLLVVRVSAKAVFKWLSWNDDGLVVHRSRDRDGLPNDVGLGLHIIVVLLDDVLHFMSVVSVGMTDVVTFAGRTHNVDMAVNTVAMNMNIVVSATAVANSVVRVVLAAIAPAAVGISTIGTIACGSITISTTIVDTLQSHHHKPPPEEPSP